LYQAGGPNLLVYRLGRLFTKIETEEQRILHNDVLADVLDIINETDPTDRLSRPEHALLRFIADTILYPKFNKRKRFLFRVGERILQLGQNKQ
jgi:hypothetical protein